MKNNVVVVGEDFATREVIIRLINHVGNLQISRTEPVRGGKTLEFLPKYNRLNEPVVALIDLDAEDCPPLLLSKIFGATPLGEKMIIRIAVDEVESWLMADREGFSHYIGVNENLIPLAQPKKDAEPFNIELKFPYKPSLYMMREIIANSTNTLLKKQLMPIKGAKKGPEYNIALAPFIKEQWDIERAMINSFSLKKAVQRINDLSVLLTA